MNSKLQNILNEYDNSPNKNRPLKISHGFPYNKSMTITQKQSAIKDKLTEYKNKGFGGIVTNVNFENNYLKNEEEWQLYRFTLQTCAEMGLRVWIYDEQGYPSGGAGGLTLENHPEWQCQAVAMTYVTTNPGEDIIIEFPLGHSYILAAYSYRISSLDEITDDDVKNPYKIYDLRNTCVSLTDKNETGGKLTTVCFFRKNMYEGTHAIHNVFQSRRYIDVANREAVAEFINNTYKPYGIYSKDCAEPEAFFTDEPSFMAAYINKGLFPPSVKDQFDESMPMFASVNWSESTENRFMSKYGYSIIPCLIYLFAGKSNKAIHTRIDFHSIMSELYEESFFSQISDYCAKINIPFSGHILLEDDIRCHVAFEGNYFSLLRHMHIPGIDMLNGTPELTRRDAFTPKLISSIAHTYNRPHVMSEVSAHAQGGKVTMDEMLGCITTQYVLGVDVFTSYFGENALVSDQYNVWNDTIGRIDKIMGGGIHIADIALYYPIETMQAFYIPCEGQFFANTAKLPEMNVCADNLSDIYKSLMNNQLDYDFLDYYAIKRSEIKNNEICVPGGEKFKVLIIPACYLTKDMKSMIFRLCKNGVKVIVFKNEMFDSYSKIPEYSGAEIVYNTSELIDIIKKTFTFTISFKDNASDVLYLCRENENGRNILLVNTSKNKISSEAAVCGLGEKVTVYDPRNNVVKGEYNKNNIEIELESYESAVIIS